MLELMNCRAAADEYRLLGRVIRSLMPIERTIGG